MCYTAYASKHCIMLCEPSPARCTVATVPAVSTTAVAAVAIAGTDVAIAVAAVAVAAVAISCYPRLSKIPRLGLNMSPGNPGFQKLERGNGEDGEALSPVCVYVLCMCVLCVCPLCPVCVLCVCVLCVCVLCVCTLCLYFV